LKKLMISTISRGEVLSARSYDVAMVPRYLT